MPDFGVLKTINLRINWEHEDEDFTPVVVGKLASLKQGLEYEP